MTYALITPARNEEAFIEGTIQSLVAQTVRPVRWIIVSDGSSDGTDDIVKRYAAEHDWIELLRMPEHRDRQFAAKANCFNAGYARLSALSSQLSGFSWDLIGNLDADITLPPDYYEFLLSKFNERPKLGVTGTPFVEDSTQPDKHTYAHGAANLEHVSGACQIFRRECFEEVGGYVPIKGGAIDWIAVTTARMKGWETRTFTERVCFHHRKIGTGNHSPLIVKFHYGRKAYYVGGHPVWEILRGCFQMRQRPLILGGVYHIAGYLWGAITRMHRPVSRELMAFHRSEQMARLKRNLGLNAQVSNSSTSASRIKMSANTTTQPVSTPKERTLTCEGKWLKIARIHDEIWLDGAAGIDPQSCVTSLRAKGLKADIFTFAQALPEIKPRFSFKHDWDSLAVALPQQYDQWWESLPQESRKNVRRSQRRGVTVRVVPFDDAFVKGIKEIYDETPIRQGRKFWHYGKDFETVKRENGTYADRSEFIGAFHGEELIGFIKMVYVDNTARIMQIISKNAHYDKRPTNSLLTKAMEICRDKGVTEFIYGQYIYGPKASSSVTEFKRRTGFHEVLLPRYYIPLTLKGRIVLALGLHRGIKNVLPESLLNFLLEQRTRYYNRKLAGTNSSGSAPAKASDESETAVSGA